MAQVQGESADADYVDSLEHVIAQLHQILDHLVLVTAEVARILTALKTR